MIPGWLRELTQALKQLARLLAWPVVAVVRLLELLAS